MTIDEALRSATAIFDDAGIEAPKVESEFLMASLLGHSRADVLLRRHERLGNATRLRFHECVLERKTRKPLAYVTGEQPFYGYSLQVNSDVLVPRPETELLVEEAYRFLDRQKNAVTAIDVGTGSGAIAVLLAKHPKVARVVGIDLSTKALDVAGANARALDVSERCEFREGNLLGSLRATEKVELIIANLPYIKTNELSRLPHEVQWEPQLALDGGVDGLDLIEALMLQAPAHLAAEGELLLEIGYDQSAPVVRSLNDAPTVWKEVRALPDWAGHLRMISAVKKGV